VLLQDGDDFPFDPARFSVVQCHGDSVQTGIVEWQAALIRCHEELCEVLSLSGVDVLKHYLQARDTRLSDLNAGGRDHNAAFLNPTGRKPGT
jgi:hypothetical protein